MEIRQLVIKKEKLMSSLFLVKFPVSLCDRRHNWPSITLHLLLHPHPVLSDTAPWLGGFGEPDFWGSFLSCASAFTMRSSSEKLAAGSDM